MSIPGVHQVAAEFAFAFSSEGFSFLLPSFIFSSLL